MNPKPHRGRGNKNAAKAKDKKRITLSLRVLPETKERLKRAAEAYGSMSRAVDHLASSLQESLTSWNRAPQHPPRFKPSR